MKKSLFRMYHGLFTGACGLALLFWACDSKPSNDLKNTIWELEGPDTYQYVQFTRDTYTNWLLENGMDCYFFRQQVKYKIKDKGFITFVQADGSEGPVFAYELRDNQLVMDGLDDFLIYTASVFPVAALDSCP